MARLIWTETAINDLDQIADYISLDDPDAARRLVRRVFDHVDNLQEFPELGPHPRDLPGRLYRHLVIPPLRVFYRIDTGSIYIIYVMRSERLLRVENLQDRDSS